MKQASSKEDYLTPRDKNDDNSTYTVADAVFSACFLNMVMRNADIVGMANFAPMVNTRGCIFTHDKGIVLRSTYHVFELYTRLMGAEIVDLYGDESPVYEVVSKEGNAVKVAQVDVLATKNSMNGTIAVSLVNKHETDSAQVTLKLKADGKNCRVETLCGQSADDYNDVDRNTVVPFENSAAAVVSGDEITVILPAHSVNILTLN